MGLRIEGDIMVRKTAIIFLICFILLASIANVGAEKIEEKDV